MRHVLSIVILVIFTLPTNGLFANCNISPEEYAGFFEQNYDTFDQSEKGWRMFGPGDNFCPLLAAQLIDAYILDKEIDLKDEDKRVLFFHAGQNYAFVNLYKIAIRRIHRSQNPNEPENPKLHWNAYVRATEAFLSKDMSGLKQARAAFVEPISSGDANLLKFINGFIKCFDKPYIEAYSISCH